MSVYDFTERTKKIFEKMNNENPFDWSTEIETDIIGYCSPIEIIMTDLQTKMESDCLQAVQRYGFNVDKEELIKALNYDRNQYHKGYSDAKRIYARPKGEWVVDGTFYRGGEVSSIAYRCNLCKRRLIWINIDGGKTKEEFLRDYPFCNCGADMRKENEDDTVN